MAATCVGFAYTWLSGRKTKVTGSDFAGAEFCIVGLKYWFERGVD